MSNPDEMPASERAKLRFPDPEKLHKHVSVVFANDTFSAALTALNLARVTVDRSLIELPDDSSVGAIRSAWAANHTLLVTMIDAVVIEGNAQIDAVLTFFDMK